MHGLLARPALAVERRARQADRQARSEQGVPGDVARLLASLDGATDDDVIEPVGVDAGAVDEVGEGVGEQVDGMPVAQLAAAPPDGGANGVDDDCFTGHALSPG